MPERRLRDTLRRRVAPVVFLILLGILGARACASDMAQVEIRLVLGEARAGVQALRVDVFPDGASESVAYLERSFDTGPAGADPGLEAGLSPGTYHLRIEAQTARGPRVLERSIVVSDQLLERAVIQVDLEQALLAGPPGAE